MSAGDVVMQRAALAQRHADQGVLGGFRRFADRFGHFARFAMTETDPALLIADDDKRGEAETTAALHNFRDAINVDQTVHEFAVAIFPAAAAFAFTCHQSLPSSFVTYATDRAARFECSFYA
jgi:hypothetical protein